jgi:hypothetical protein
MQHGLPHDLLLIVSFTVSTRSWLKAFLWNSIGRDNDGVKRFSPVVIIDSSFLQSISFSTFLF